MHDTPTNMQRLHLRVHGIVQGVSYRASTRRTATELGLTGWVRNCHDGSVELIAEGSREQLERLLEWCRHGPPAARVDRLDPSWSAGTGAFDAFVVRHA